MNNIDKILILVGILLGSVLVIENIVSGYPAYLFLDTGASAGFTILVSIFIGLMIGYGFRGKMAKSNDINEDYDF